MIMCDFECVLCGTCFEAKVDSSDYSTKTCPECSGTSNRLLSSPKVMVEALRDGCPAIKDFRRANQDKKLMKKIKDKKELAYADKDSSLSSGKEGKVIKEI